MKSKRLWFVFLFCALSLPLAAQTTVSIAPDAASKEDVKKLFDVMASRDQMRQMMDQVFGQMQSLTREQMKRQHPEVSDEDLAKAQRQAQEFLKNFPLDQMMDDMIPVYQKHFTKSDIDGLTAFYSSPTGQKFLHEMPAVTAETMRVLYPRIQAEVAAAMKNAPQKTDSTQK